MSNKRYYWLKLKDDFFSRKEIKKLRKIAGGDTYVIIYLKMLLLTIKNDGIFVFEGYEKDVCEELALELDEDIENVNVTFGFLERYGLVEEVSTDNFQFSESKELVGSETASTIRSRESRARKRVAMQQESNRIETHLTRRDREEKDIEKDIEKDTEIEKEKKYAHSLTLSSNSSLSQLSQEQYNNLIKKYPIDLVNRTVEKAQKYKGCYTLETIEKWIKEKIEQPKPVNTVYSKKTTNKFNDFHQREYSRDEMNELEKRLLSK